MEIILIAAMAANRVIGHNNTIPWDIPGEQTRFKEITMGHSLIMGRKTWESIGRPLPGRRNIVVTRNRDYRAPGAETVHSLDEALELCRSDRAARVFVIGGEQLYRLALPLAHTLILTVLDRSYPGDTSFPPFSEEEFQLKGSVEVAAVQPYTIQTWQRR
ncbi:dihydrofolate reductase [Desulfolithobacter dissulfuricans]|uniref:Dihydrofolate reductase n=1 Tax=Desulfolithobacter dissulfuricans TaxID=2795293 RepID=A0A915UBC8_9BACT|nr:dihydrofolate reductase [Desulfolithobacter dissulfuricans]BCO10565.1 dihydrofolate reductase [Desulfolithobacter dissulfuricans]